MSGAQRLYRALIITVLARDRPGLVENISKLVTQQQGNWLESRMASLAGRFAGILLVHIPRGNVLALRSALAALADQGIEVRVETSVEAPEVPRRTVRLGVVGLDRPGIVHEVSKVLTAHAVNIEELDTRYEESAMYGGNLFTARAILAVPDALSTPALRAAIEAIAIDLMVDLS
jgi:glycine cleavage system regulatory protein